MQSLESVDFTQRNVRIEFWSKITRPVFGDPLPFPIANRISLEVTPRATAKASINQMLSTLVSACLQTVVDERPDLSLTKILETQRYITVELGLNASVCYFRGTAYMVEFKAFVDGQLV